MQAATTQPTSLPLTHEQFIHEVREIAVARLNAQDRRQLQDAKLVYGSGGRRSVRGQCFFGAWHNSESTALIEVCAFGEQSNIQLAGTTIHELGHCLAGPGTGHTSAWKRACRTLGLVRCTAAGQAYEMRDFAPEVWARLSLLPDPSDGSPIHRVIAIPQRVSVIAKSAPCPAGIGTNHGTSRGPGSGSRLRLFMCQCSEKPYRARVASDTFLARCERCGSLFERVIAVERRRGWKFQGSTR